MGESSEASKRRRAIESIASHEWAYIKTRETDYQNKVVVSRCMHCKCERRKLYGGTGASFYVMPGEHPVKACPPCIVDKSSSRSVAVPQLNSSSNGDTK